MRLEFRHFEPAESRAARALVLSFAGAVGAGAVWISLGLPVPVCVFHRVTGLPCVTCGGTRCFASLLHGEMAAAFLFNPLVFLVLSAVLVSSACMLPALLLGWALPVLRGGPRVSGRALGFAAAGVLAANWIYLVVTLP